MPAFLPISIITATYNAAALLPNLLESLVSQTHRDFELVIQDGGSTDETVAVAERYRSRLPALSVSSMPDSGIYDAWNKAVCRARGKWLLFLGADDRLHDADSLADSLKILEHLPSETDFLAASLQLTLPDGTIIEIWKPAADIHGTLPSGMSLPHPALFYRRALFDRNRFSLAYTVAGDYEFLCRTVRRDNYVCSPMIVSRMSIGGASGSLPSMLDGELETFAISRKYFPGSFRIRPVCRILRSAGYRLVAKLAGESAGRIFADFARLIQGKPRLWTREQRRSARSALSGQPLISLVVATRGRTEEVRSLLASLEAQTYQNFEVLIVDQNAQGYLDDSLAAYRSLLNMTVLHMAPQGVSAARNMGLEQARGKIVAFPDDDCCYAPHTLEKIVRIFQNNVQLEGVIVGWSEDSDAGGEKEDGLQKITIFNAFYRAETYCQFYAAEVVDDVRFDPQLGPGTELPYGCGEDTDFLLQLLKKGVLVKRTSEVLVFHQKPDWGNPALLPKTYAYAQGRVYVLYKHKFPFWFVAANIGAPLCRFFFEGPKAWAYRKAMFLGRLRAAWKLRKGNICL